MSSMKLANKRVRKLSRSEGALNIIIEGTRFEDSNESNEDVSPDGIKDVLFNSTNSSSKTILNNRNKAKRKEGTSKMPDMMTRLLYSNRENHSNNGNSNNKKRRRKESLIYRMLSFEKDDDLADIDAFVLRSAVRKFDAARVIELVSRGKTNIDGSNQYGVSALHEASIDGNLVCIKILVNHGAKINNTDTEGFTPLDYAVFAGNFECAAYLIDKGACDDNIKDGQIVKRAGKKERVRRETVL